MKEDEPWSLGQQAQQCRMLLGGQLSSPCWNTHFDFAFGATSADEAAVAPTASPKLLQVFSVHTSHTRVSWLLGFHNVLLCSWKTMKGEINFQPIP